MRRERSLEKIHTFDLKNHLRRPSVQKEPKDDVVIEPGLLIGDKKIRGSSAMPTPKVTGSLLLLENPSTPSTEKNAAGTKKGRATYYVEEQFDVLSGVVMRADPVLTELVSTIKQFERYVTSRKLVRRADMPSSMLKSMLGSHPDLFTPASEEEERRKLKVAFASLNDIEALRWQRSGGQHYVRSSLGLVKQDEDWIFSINIGNVMSMAPLSVEELSSNNGVKSETYHEVARDSMLEKIILIIIAYFCIATEMRFIAKELNKSGGGDQVQN